MDKNSTNNTTAATDYNLPLHICNVILGVLGMVANFAVMLVIFKTKELRNKSQYVIFCHALSEFAFALAKLARGAQEITNFVNQWPLAMSEYACFFLAMRQRIGAEWSCSVTMMLGIDRLLAVKFPIFYKDVNVVKYLIVFNLVALAFGLESPILGPFLTLPYATGTVASCGGGHSALHLKVNRTLTYVVSGITVAVYVMSLSIVGYKYWGTKWASEAQKSEWTKRIQFNAFKTIMIIFSIYLFCWVASEIKDAVLKNTNVASPYVSNMITSYLTLLLSLNGISHFFVYFFSSPRFKRGFKKLVLGEKSTVVSSVQIAGNSKNLIRNAGGGVSSGL